MSSPLPVRFSHAELLARRIEDEIVAAGWPVRTVLGTESALLVRYGVGRAVLRETVRILESHGVARRRPGPGGGLVVARPDTRAILDATRLFLDFRQVTPDDLYETWLALERIAVRRLAATIDAAGVERLRDVLAEEDFSAGRDAVERANLHVEIARLSGNPATELFLHTVLAVSRARGRTELRPAQVLWLRGRHAELVEAIVRGDADAAEDLVRAYVEEVAAANAVPDGTAVDGPEVAEAVGG